MKKASIFDSICTMLDLGKIKGHVRAVSGGYMHKMYRMKTDRGEYAVKLLNPEIMKRQDVFDNFKLAEQLESRLEESQIPIVPALTFNGAKMQCIDHQYFYVFNWINAQALRLDKINEYHCARIGKTLAQIHGIEKIEQAVVFNKINIDWDYYISESAVLYPKISKLLGDNRDILYSQQENAYKYAEKLPPILTICNGDMDPKNVLWLDNAPKIIDLECLKYSNPFLDLFQLSLCWSGYETCKLNYNLLEAFVSAYIRESGTTDIDWQALYYTNTGRLEWLEYNLKRALLIECSDKKEQKLGINQVKETMTHIIYYDKIHDELILRLSSV